MKTRNGFVSNSSSASFVLNKADLKPFQICAIEHHLEFGKLFGMDRTEQYNEWEIIGVRSHRSKEIELSTSMDNFDMWEFLMKIGVPENVIPKREEW